MAEEAQKPTPEEAPSAVPAAPEPEPDWATRYKYLLAEFDNFRRRAEREREAVRASARADLLRSVLPVYEASLKAREAVADLEPGDPVRQGVELLATAWISLLEGQKVTPVAQAGRPFEAASHEAVAETPATRKSPAGTIVEVVQQGYRMNGALLRPAKVVVARSPPPPTPEAGTADVPTSSEE